MLFALTAVLIASAVVQLVALYGMGRRRPIGDEAAYLSGRDLFLRPPILPWLASLARRGGGAGALRLSMSILSVATIGVTAAAGWHLGGPTLALLSAVILAGLPERILLGCHIWPDTLLAFVFAVIALVWVSTLPGAAVAWIVGALAVIGVLIRIDALLVPFVLLAAWPGAHGPLSGSIAALILAPSGGVVLALSGLNYRRSGIPWPDTTWAFNLLVMRSEAQVDRGLEFAAEPVIQKTVDRWRALAPGELPRAGWTALGDTLRSPWRLLRGLGRRLLAMLGPDTFALQMLLPKDRAYPQLGARARRLWSVATRFSFPLLVTILVFAATNGWVGFGSFAWPSGGLFLLTVAFHARTRYRVAILPAASLIAGQALMAARHDPPTIGHWIAAALVLALLGSISCGTELPTPKTMPPSSAEDPPAPD